MTMERFANHILARANENNIPVTNLTLQKVMYFVLRNSSTVLNRNQQEEIYNEPFLVWRYGPVVESQYNRFYMFGSDKILGEYSSSSEYAPLNDLIDKFLNINVFQMVNASHSHPFWKNNENQIILGRSNVPYPLDEVLRNG